MIAWGGEGQAAARAAGPTLNRGFGSKGKHAMLNDKMNNAEDP